MITPVFLLIVAAWLSASLYQHCVGYSLGTFDCKHMSIRQAQFFKRLGFDVSFWEAELNDREDHVYLKLKIGPLSLPWEPTCLLPIPPELWFHSDFLEAREIEKEDIDLTAREIRKLEGRI